MNNVVYDFVAMKEVDIRAVDPETLVDIRHIDIEPRLPFVGKVVVYLDQIKNAYCFKCGDVIVKISYVKTTTTINDNR